MTFPDVLKICRAADTQTEKGTMFERLMANWLRTDPVYSSLTKVWLWSEFPARKDFGTGQDIGIDLVAQNDLGEYWAIQCKCYADDTYISESDVTHFLSTSAKKFTDPETLNQTQFANRLFITTSDKWSRNAEASLENQTPAVNRVTYSMLCASPVNWDELFAGKSGDKAKEQKHKSPLPHQKEAVEKCHAYFAEHERGKLIMACGTGKTYTSLCIVENELPERGLVLFLVPSISLLGQTLNSWSADATRPIRSICICSDATASRRNKLNEMDENQSSVVDLALPATTNAKSIAKQLTKYRNHDGLVVVFSTYQSISAVHDAQQEILRQTQGNYGTFDYIICDEAHRTTGVKIAGAEDDSEFVKIHDNDFVKGRHRLYMTATPRVFGDTVKAKATLSDCVLFSMDNPDWYGEEIYHVGFGYAVENGLLTDYKVFVLTVNEKDIPEELRKKVQDGNSKELRYDDVAKLVGVVSGLSKIIRGDDGKTWEVDPQIMHRALAFCSSIGNVNKPGTSKNIEAILPEISKQINDGFPDIEHLVHVTTQHVDGSMSSSEREKHLQWLSEAADDPNECRVITNVRCLSEGVDVPALDAVIFLSPRNSQVDVVQSVGRVMRNFGKGTSNEKKYGYIIIPVVLPIDADPDSALNASDFKTVWSILNALRSHDDRFNATVNKIELNKNRPQQITIGRSGIGSFDGFDDHSIDASELESQLQLQFGEFQDKIYAKLVDKVGDRLYWENWAKQVGVIAQKFIDRITRLVSESSEYNRDMEEFVRSLQHDLNPSVDQAQAIEMLAQHMITKPVFDALFSSYEFVKNNSVSISMEKMLVRLHTDAFEKDTEELQRFYESVRNNVHDIDNLQGKQTIIKNLYEKFFKGAFPKTVEQLGIVYTPVQCVDFIIRSVNDILQSEFHTSLSAEGVHILDPFTGTGTFITRLLQSGLISSADLERKYRNEIHCNEIVLLAFYIADVNIESVFHDLTHRAKYLPYDNICLTDTFQLAEPDHNVLFTEYFQQNSEKVSALKKTPIRVIIGNPPYSIGQDSANDNAQNLSYPAVDGRIAATYAKDSIATNKKALYDSYIKAFRWASDRIPANEGGIVAFISNGAWLDGNSQDGMRQCLEQEFSSIYVLNLRGNQRTSGELSRKEGGKIFDSGCRCPIAITILVKNPAHKKSKATIHYHDIGDYLSRDAKLELVKKFQSINGIQWDIITPNEKNDWINQRDGVFDTLIPLCPEKKFDPNAKAVFTTNSCGLKTNRDAWCYNFSLQNVSKNISSAIDFYNSEVDRYAEIVKENPNASVANVLNMDATKFSWDRAQKDNDVAKGVKYFFDKDSLNVVTYRPFCKMHGYMNKQLNSCVYKMPVLFPTQQHENLLIGILGIGANKDFSAYISSTIQDVQNMFNCQCFPLYWYKKNEGQAVQQSLFGDEQRLDEYSRQDGISNWILKEVRSRFSGTKVITKESIFYYVYGLLHSPDYRTRFADDLKKSLPRIPIVEKVEDFITISSIGKQLADLHLHYEQKPAPASVTVEGDPFAFPEDYALAQLGDYTSEQDATYYQPYDVIRMQFQKVRDDKGKLVPDKSVIIYNNRISISNIPLNAYDYVVNGKSAIEWIMERYAVTTDKASGIVNNPNLWSREHSQPRYILSLLLSVISLSVETNRLVAQLPQLKL